MQFRSERGGEEMPSSERGRNIWVRTCSAAIIIRLGREPSEADIGGASLAVPKAEDEKDFKVLVERLAFWAPIRGSGLNRQPTGRVLRARYRPLDSSPSASDRSAPTPSTRAGVLRHLSESSGHLFRQRIWPARRKCPGLCFWSCRRRSHKWAAVFRRFPSASP